MHEANINTAPGWVLNNPEHIIHEYLEDDSESNEMKGDYSSTDGVFKITPSAEQELMLLEDLSFYVKTTDPLAYGGWGSKAGGLTNGMLVRVYDTLEETTKWSLPGVIKFVYDIYTYSGSKATPSSQEMESLLITMGAAVYAGSFHLNLQYAGVYVQLRYGQEFQVVLQDDMTAAAIKLASQYAVVRGLKGLNAPVRNPAAPSSSSSS